MYVQSAYTKSEHSCVVRMFLTSVPIFEMFTYIFTRVLVLAMTTSIPIASGIKATHKLLCGKGIIINYAAKDYVILAA